MPTTAPEWQTLALYAVAAAVILLLLQRIPVVGRIIRFGFSAALLAFLIFILLQQAPYQPELARLTQKIGLDDQQIAGKELKVRMSPDGHFWVVASINGVKRRMLIDSGATVTAIASATAREAQGRNRHRHHAGHPAHGQRRRARADRLGRGTARRKYCGAQPAGRVGSWPWRSRRAWNEFPVQAGILAGGRPGTNSRPASSAAQVRKLTGQAVKARLHPNDRQLSTSGKRKAPVRPWGWSRQPCAVAMSCRHA